MKYGYIIIMILMTSIFLVGCQDKDYFISNQYPNPGVIYDEDLRFPVSAIKVTGSSNLPSFGSFIGKTQILYFSPSSIEQAFVTAQFPHAKIDNSTIMPHFHWTFVDEQASGDVVWCMEYTCANIDFIFPLTNISCVIDTAQAPLQHHITDMIHIKNTFNLSAMCAIRIFRNATNPLDTFNADAGLLEYDIHYLNIFYGRRVS